MGMGMGAYMGGGSDSEPMDSGDEGTDPEEQDEDKRLMEIGADLGRLAKNVRDPAIRTQLETYGQEITDMCGPSSDEPSESGDNTPAATGGAGDKLAVAQLRKSVKV